MQFAACYALYFVVSNRTEILKCVLAFYGFFIFKVCFEQQHHHWAEGEVESFSLVHRDKHCIVLSCLPNTEDVKTQEDRTDSRR